MKTLKSRNWVFRWHIINFPNNAPKYKAIAVFERVFALAWQEIHPLRFESTDDKDNADITLEFRMDYQKLDPPSGSIAYWHYPHSKTPWVIVFDDHINWLRILKSGDEKLLGTALHEVYHTLALPHTTNKNCVMYPNNSAGHPLTLCKKSRGILSTLYRLERAMASNYIIEYAKRSLDWVKILTMSKKDREHLARAIWLESSDAWHIIKRIYN